MTSLQYRVVWQRAGLPKRRKLYETKRGVDAFVAKLNNPPVESPDDYVCCSGWECGCQGVTNAEAHDQHYANMPRLIFGPVIESRPVGEWS